MEQLLDQKPEQDTADSGILPARTGRAKRSRRKRPAQDKRIRAALRRGWENTAGFRKTAFLYSRRAFHRIHNVIAESRTIGPISFLGVSTALGVALTVTTLYTSSYAVSVDGEMLGVVLEQSVVSEAIATVETEGSSLLGYPYKIEGDVDYQFTLARKDELIDERDVEYYFYDQLNSVSDQLRKYEMFVGSQSLGVVKDEAALEELLASIKAQYITPETVSAEFVEDLTVQYVYTASSILTIEELQEALSRNTTGETTYTVAKGDTFNAVAYKNDMSVSDLKALNPSVDINRLRVGEVLHVKEVIPVLSVRTVSNLVYNEAIECPVEKREDSSMYKGDSKIITQGVEGEALIEAKVTYVNGYEREREVLTSTTLREPTTTIQAVGTKERPKTASKGTYRWPISGRITSYFGGRYIFGRYSYHAGLDISAPKGTTIVAADGGTVTFSGYKGSYGNLIIITHDNGAQSYYAHCSSLLVSAGTKVYQGQSVARVGNSGRSTGYHLHFEMRVNGTAVNPLSYLR